MAKGTYCSYALNQLLKYITLSFLYYTLFNRVDRNLSMEIFFGCYFSLIEYSKVNLFHNLGTSLRSNTVIDIINN